jgi:hypothetical protein
VVLLQRRALPPALAGLLAALVLDGPCAVGLARPGPAQRAVAEPAPGRADHRGRRAARVTFAIGLDRWRGRIAAAANFQMLLSFVLPESILGVALLLVVTNLLKFIALGTLPRRKAPSDSGV